MPESAGSSASRYLIFQNLIAVLESSGSWQDEYGWVDASVYMTMQFNTFWWLPYCTSLIVCYR